jgi:hypothetical protein
VIFSDGDFDEVAGHTKILFYKKNNCNDFKEGHLDSFNGEEFEYYT